MSSSSLEHKTIRPGSLAGYSYYHSNRQLDTMVVVSSARSKAQRKLQKKVFIVVMALALAVVVLPQLIAQFTKGNASAPISQVTNKVVKIVPPSSHPVVAAAAPAAPCAANTLDKLIKVSVNQRHLWACAGNKLAHSAPVITGILAHESTLTPPGTYHIYSKITNTTLTGADETGSWKDPVSYWMPFLDNQHGTYGFHDATWRAADAFGKIDPNSADASHGCVELPLATSKWLYDWSTVGTTVTIES